MKSSRSVAALRALCRLNLPAEVMAPALLEALHGVVPSLRNLFDWTDEHGQLLRYCVEGPIDVHIAQLYFDEFHNRREAEVMPSFQSLREAPAGVRSAAQLDHAGFFGSALYQEVWRPQGLHTRLEAVLRGRSGRLIGSLVLYRGPRDPRFTRADEQLLQHLLPDLAAAFEAQAPAGAEQRHVPAREPPETLLLALDGRLRHASPGAQTLLLMAEGGASRDRLSHPLELLAGRWLGLLIAQLRSRAVAQQPSQLNAPPASMICVTPAGRLWAVGALLQPLGAFSGADVLAQITLRRLEPHAVALDRALRELPLTPGQMAVCRELYHGHARAQIGQRLGVASATVVDHVRKAYQRLELRSQHELRALLDARIHAPQELAGPQARL